MSSQRGSTSRGVQSESRARQTTKLRWEQVLQFLKLRKRSKARSRAEGPDVQQATRDTGAHQHQSNPTPATPETADVQTHSSTGRYAAVDSASNHNPEPSQATSRLRTPAHNLLTESWTSICHMGIAEARELDQFLNRIENGYHRERLTSLTAIGFNGHVEQASCAFFDGGSDDNTIEVSVMNRLGIPWTRIENSHVSLRPRMGLCQYDGRPIPVLGFGAIQWSFRNFPGFLFTTPVKVVGDGYGQEILFGHGFRRDLRNAINEVKDADENGPRRCHGILPFSFPR
ncbi:hypothetical protein H2204_001831 [Knufia peltigerae]|uniref:Uncharacterized protein n=1 Tax=Knufia peltigerae TaxID=1002370 RepID=A0AA38YC11_9EURO|nr:hypothetical protein H2204_001831 [Knufia peltigerae]